MLLNLSNFDINVHTHISLIQTPPVVSLSNPLDVLLLLHAYVDLLLDIDGFHLSCVSVRYTPVGSWLADGRVDRISHNYRRDQ
jgi:hypothetical protein